MADEVKSKVMKRIAKLDPEGLLRAAQIALSAAESLGPIQTALTPFMVKSPVSTAINALAMFGAVVRGCRRSGHTAGLAVLLDTLEAAVDELGAEQSLEAEFAAHIKAVLGGK